MAYNGPPLSPAERIEGKQKMVEWFRRFYSDANSELPYETREGGFQLVDQDDLDCPSEILSGEFCEDYPEDLIAEAAEEVDEGDSPTWFRTADVFPDDDDGSDD